jgi:uncharacterized protein YyaL (SSP411 family)
MSPHEVVIAGNLHQTDTQALIYSLYTHFLPSVQIHFQPADVAGITPSKSAGSRIDHTNNEKATAYVCSRHTCSPPVTNPETLINLLGGGSSSVH